MKTGSLYTIVFMFVVSVIFTGTLAITNKLSENKIVKNRELNDRMAILASLDIVSDDDLFEKDLNGQSIYMKTGENGEEAFAVRFSGPGLWGTIKGYIAVSADLKTLIGIEFTEQNETPGLGGRISEDWFKEQFRGLDLTEGIPIKYEDGIDAITGATLSSSAVLKIINTFVERTLPELKVEDE